MANDSTPSPLTETIENFFQKEYSDKAEKKNLQNKKKRNVRELEFALTVLLVDLASCDQNFDMEEYNRICAGLHRVFGTTPSEVSKLVNQAEATLSNMRGVDNFIKIINDNLDDDEKLQIMEIIEDVIGADGVEDGFETYLRSKFLSLLSIGKVAA